MRRVFDDELQKLHEQFLEMGELVITSVNHSLDAFLKRHVEKAREVIDQDKAINSMEVQIEKNCITLIALQQPVASDLRNIVGIMRATSDLERIGDHAVSIAKAGLHITDLEKIEDVETMLKDMGKIVESMLKRVKKAYVVFDAKEARQIAESDEAVDIYLKKVIKATTKYLLENPGIAVEGLEYVQVASYLERIGDYITNLCERIIYTTTGKITELN